MKYEVFLTQDAENDIFAIYDYIFRNDGENKASYVFQKLNPALHRCALPCLVHKIL